MSTNKNIEQKVERALQSMEGHTRATPGPYLLTRINARLNLKSNPTSWDKFYVIITRPIVAITCMAIILLLNILIITSGGGSDTVRFQTESNSDWQGYSNTNTSTLYDVENMEP